MAGWKREMPEGEGKWTMLDWKCQKALLMKKATVSSRLSYQYF